MDLPIAAESLEVGLDPGLEHASPSAPSLLMGRFTGFEQRPGRVEISSTQEGKTYIVPRAGGGGGSSGKRSVKVLPLPGRDCTEIEPP